MQGIREAAMSSKKENTSELFPQHDYGMGAGKINAARIQKTKVRFSEEEREAIISALQEAIEDIASDEYISQRVKSSVDNYLEIKTEEEADGIDTTGALLDCMDEIADYINLNYSTDGRNSTLAQIAVSVLVKTLGLKFEGTPSTATSSSLIPGDLDEDAYRSTASYEEDELYRGAGIDE